MAFTSKNLFESESDEQARLAQAPEGSKSRFLAGLPISIEHPHKGMLVELPNQWHDVRPERRVVVVLVEQRGSSFNQNLPQGSKFRRNSTWNVTVVASTDDRYPVDGYDLAVNEEELRRGRTLAPQQILDAMSRSAIPTIVI